jgi:hypothetical protein
MPYPARVPMVTPMLNIDASHMIFPGLGWYAAIVHQKF